MDAIGLDSTSMAQQVAIAALGVLFIFFIVSPIGGYFLHKFIKNHTPDTDAFALIAGAFIEFIVVTGLTLAIILQFVEQTEAAFIVALIISTLVGLVTTAVSALLIVRFIERGKKKINLDQLNFSVWEEDKRNKPKNFRQRR
jgi:uncharacterized SAM-binding protein YcdF (DUF218 family)